MLAVRNTHSRSLPARPGSVTVARHWAAETAARLGAEPEVVQSVRLAVSEAVTNAVLHAYGEAPDQTGGAEHQVHVTLAIAEEEFWVLVADDGCGHQSTPSSPGLGWGLALIADACRHFLITERSGGGTELRMGFALHPRQGAAAA